VVVVPGSVLDVGVESVATGIVVVVLVLVVVSVSTPPPAAWFGVRSVSVAWPVELILVLKAINLFLLPSLIVATVG